MADPGDDLRCAAGIERGAVRERGGARGSARRIGPVGVERAVDRLATPAVDDEVELEGLRRPGGVPRGPGGDRAAVDVDGEDVVVAGLPGVLGSWCQTRSARSKSQVTDRSLDL